MKRFLLSDRGVWLKTALLATLVLGCMGILFGAKEGSIPTREAKLTDLKFETAPNGQKYAIITFIRTDDPANSIYDIEVSGDLRQWTTLQPDDLAEQELTNEPGAPQRVQVRLNIPSTRFERNYYRVRVTKDAFQFQQAPTLPVRQPVDNIEPQTVNTTGLTDVTANTQVQFGGIFHNRRTFQSTVNASIKNTSATPIPNPIYLVITSISDPSITVANGDDTTTDGKPLFDFSAQVPGGTLDPGETTATRPLVFNNPLLKPFTVTVSVFQGAAAPAGAVTLSLTTDGNHSIIMMSEAPAFSGIPTGVGEELTVRVNNTTAPTQVKLDQVLSPGGRGQIFFGAAGSATFMTVTTSGGAPNQVKVMVRYAKTSAFNGDIKIRALVNAVVEAEKFVTAITASISPKCIYLSDQRPVVQILTVNPPIAGVKLNGRTFAVHGSVANPSNAGGGARSIATQSNVGGGARSIATQSNVGGGANSVTTTAGGTALFVTPPCEYESYCVQCLSPERISESDAQSPAIYRDYKCVKTSDKEGDPYTKPGPGTEYCPSCPGGAGSDTPKSVDLSDGEKKLISPDLAIPGRGFDYEFYRAYRSFNYRRNFDRKDFGENWTYSYADEFLFKDGSGADTDANYVFFRGGQTAYMFVRIAPGVWAPEIQQFTRLRINPSTGDFEVRDQSGMVEVFHNFSATSTPNANGRLKEMRDRNGNVMRFLYGQPTGLSKFVLTTVIDTMGRSIAYRYYVNSDPNPGRRGRLMEIEDFRRDNSVAGRKVRFDYDTEGNLVSVTSPIVQGTPGGNDFLSGKTFRYKYITTANLPTTLTPEQKDRLLHKLTHIWHPNEVGNNPTVNPADILAAERLVYETSPSNPFFGFVTAYTVGGLNANGVPAGGTIHYTYTDLNPTRAMGPGNNIDPTPLIQLRSLQIAVQDRNGNQAEYIFGGENKLLEYSEFTRGLRAGEPARFTMTYQYNKDRLLIRRTMPEGNVTEWAYDEQNPDRYQQANLLQMVRIPDAARGGDQTRLATRYVYDPVYNQPCLIIEPRGTDSTFVPPFGGPASPIRYATSYAFDYQEGPNSDAQKQRLADVLGVSLQVMKDIIEFNEAQVEAALGLSPGSFILLGKVDINGDGLTDQIHGNHLQKFSPRVKLLAGSNQAAIEGGTNQEIVERFTYNQFGQMLSRVDPEANVHTSEYFPETDPDGDGTPSPAPVDGRILVSTTGGYLKQTTADTASDPVRDNRMNPAPVNIRKSFTYDDVGNVVSMTNGRGIRTSYFVNELNQVVQTTRAAAVPALGSGNPPEPITLTAFAYLERTFYDFNNNVTRRQVEDRGNTSNTGAFVDFAFKYDILDRQIEMAQEVDVTKSLVTRYRYDANENRLMTIHPAGNAESTVYDERDLEFQSIRGAATRPPTGLFAVNDPTSFDRAGGAGTVPGTTTYNYDKNKNVVETVDAENNGGAKSSIAGGVGDVTRYTYDGYDRRKTVTDPLGNRTNYGYDPASNMVRVRQDGDPADDIAGASQNKTLAATEYIYDELSRVVATHHVLFQTPDVTPARPTTLTDTAAMDAFAPYLADASSDTASVPGATGIAVIGRVTTLTEYDRASRATFTVQDDLDNYRTDYDGASRVIRTLDSALGNGDTGQASLPVFNPALLSGNAVERAHDDNNNVIEMLETDVTDITGIAPEQFRTTYLYDSLDRVQTTFDNRDHTTDYRYDSRNNLVAMADAQGPVRVRTANRRGLGSTARVTLNNFGNVTRSSYDALNRLLLTETILTASGQGDGANIGATLEGVKNATPTPDPSQSEDGKIKVWRAHDDNSELLALRDDDGNTTGYIYDNQNRLLKERKGMNAGFQGTAFTITGGDSGVFNEPRTPPDPLKDPPVETETANTDNGTTITYAYDRDSNLIQVLDEAGNVRDYTYDALNRRKTLGITRASGFVGTTSQNWKYDGLGRLTECTDNNEPAQATDDVLCTYAYDSLSRKIEESQKIGPLSAKVVSFDYEIDCSCGGAVGLASVCTYPDGRRVHSSYDRLDRLVSRNDEGFSDIGKYQYMGKGRVATLTYQNGTRLTHIGQVAGQNADVGFDNLRRITNHRWESFAPGTPLGNGTLIVGFGYQQGNGAPAYDRTNNKLIEEKLHDPGNSEVFVYDSAHRLVDPGSLDYRGINGAFRRGTLNAAKADIATLTITPGELQKQDWTLDGLGNWTQNIHTTQGGPAQAENRTHSDFNEIFAVTGTPYGDGVIGTHVLDKNGNLTDDGVRIYGWDALNRLRTVKKKSNGDLVGAYTYDCANRRMRKVISNAGIDGTAINGTTDFHYDGWRVVEEHNGSDAVIQQYAYGNYLDEVLTLDNRRSGTALAQLNDRTGNERLFYHGNTLDHIYALTSEGNGAAPAIIQETYRYDAYGKASVFTGPGSDGSWFTGDEPQAGSGALHNNPYTYTAQRLDAEASFMYFKARYYSPVLGRFISRDSLGYIDGLNVYFAHFVPNFADPLGESRGRPEESKPRCCAKWVYAHGGKAGFESIEDCGEDWCKENWKQCWSMKGLHAALAAMLLRQAAAKVPAALSGPVLSAAQRNPTAAAGAVAGGVVLLDETLKALIGHEVCWKSCAKERYDYVWDPDTEHPFRWLCGGYWFGSWKCPEGTDEYERGPSMPGPD